jgi:hypothetical protein
MDKKMVVKRVAVKAEKKGG